MIDAKLKGEGIDAEADVPLEATSNVVDLMAALKKNSRPIAGGSPRQGQEDRRCPPDSPEAANQGQVGGCTRRKGPTSGGDKVCAQTRLIRLVLVPAVDADQPPPLFKADNAIDLCFGDHVADLVVAKAALGALETEHDEPPAVRPLA